MCPISASGITEKLLPLSQVALPEEFSPSSTQFQLTVCCEAWLPGLSHAWAILWVSVPSVEGPQHIRALEEAELSPPLSYTLYSPLNAT